MPIDNLSIFGIWSLLVNTKSCYLILILSMQWLKFIADRGATGVLIEYEDTFPYQDRISTLALPFAFKFVFLLFLLLTNINFSKIILSLCFKARANRKNQNTLQRTQPRIDSACADVWTYGSMRLLL